MGVGHYVGVIGGGHRDYSKWTRTENGQQREVTGHSTTVFTDEAIALIKQQQTTP